MTRHYIKTNIASANVNALQSEVDAYVERLLPQLWLLNKYIHEQAEVAWQERRTHDALVKFFRSFNQFEVAPHAYGVETAFEVIFTNGDGPQINFNAEMDALPGIGHACGHNLIAIGSVVGFLSAAWIMKEKKLGGRLQLLGTPAEELGGGKQALLEKSAYEDDAVSLMAHPMNQRTPQETDPELLGYAGSTSLAIRDIIATYTGKSAHAAAAPWEGVNALDALVSSYNNISMLRQQIQPDERVHGAITKTPSVSNAIPDSTQVSWSYRSPTLERCKSLGERVANCLKAGALATGCKIDLEATWYYANLIPNAPLCKLFQEKAAMNGIKVARSLPSSSGGGSTDQGNVSHAIPALHAMVGIPAAEGANNHTRPFAAAAGTREAFDRYIAVGKSLGMTATAILEDNTLLRTIQEDFEDTQAQFASASVEHKIPE